MLLAKRLLALEGDWIAMPGKMEVEKIPKVLWSVKDILILVTDVQSISLQHLFFNSVHSFTDLSWHIRGIAGSRATMHIIAQILEARMGR